MNRALASFLVLVIIGVSSVFGAGGREVAGDEEIVEIELWYGRANFLPDDAFKTFHRENPNIRVNYDLLDLNENAARFTRAHAAGQAPDIVQVNWPFFPTLIEQGLVLDLTQMYRAWEADNPEQFNDFYPDMKEAMRHDGAYMGVNMFQHAVLHMYQKDILDELGLDPPRDFDEAIEVARVVRERMPNKLGYTFEARPEGSGVWAIAYFRAMGGEYVNGVPQFDSEAGRYFLRYFQTLMRENLVHPDTVSWYSGEQRGALIDGAAALGMIDDHILVGVQEAQEYGKDWAINEFPHRPGAEDKRRLTSHYFPFQVNKNSAHKIDAILKVFQYLAETEIAASVSVRYMPAVLHSVQKHPDLLATQPWLEDIADQLAQTSPMPLIPATIEMNRIIQEARIEVMMNPNADVAEVARQAQQRIDEVAGR